MPEVQLDGSIIHRPSAIVSLETSLHISHSASSCSDGARCLKVGVHENWTYRRPFTNAICASLAGSLGASLPPEKVQFWIGGDAISRCLGPIWCQRSFSDRADSIGSKCHWHYKKLQAIVQLHFHLKVRLEFETFCTDKSRKQFPTPPSLFLCKFGLITRPIFSKSGKVRTPRPAMSPPVSWKFYWPLPVCSQYVCLCVFSTQAG